METLKGKPKVKRTMWSRRAQEYEAKINSGEIVLIAEVTRALFRPDDQPEAELFGTPDLRSRLEPPRARTRGDGEDDEPTALEKILDVLREHAPQYYENTARRVKRIRNHSKPGRSPAPFFFGIAIGEARWRAFVDERARRLGAAMRAAW